MAAQIRAALTARTTLPVRITQFFAQRLPRQHRVLDHELQLPSATPDQD